ncbi:MAG: FkbM family methyltransferase, partial [Betaproteobacteria bacterium]
VLAFDLPALEVLTARVSAATDAQHIGALTPGINLVGFAYGEFGLGESLRALARAADAGGIPFVVKDVDQRLLARQADRSIAGHVSESIGHQFTLLCLNPDMLKPVLTTIQQTKEGGGRNAGYWYWELEHLPRIWDDALAAMDELWCATEFIATAIRRSTDKPVLKIPPPIELQFDGGYTRADFALPPAPYLFLFTFDFNSFVMRKNPEAVVRAFRNAFPPGRDDVGLVVKSINGANQPELVARLRALIAGDPRIVQMDRFLSRDEAYGLISVCDAYVSLHRSEGFGLGLAEAMYLGKPVVGTAYSGNLEFMNEGNSALVDYRMVPVLKGQYLYDDPRFVWADADIDDAARHLRRLADDVEWRLRVAAAGQHDIRTLFTRERAAASMRARLVELSLLAPVVSAESARSKVFVSWAQNGEDALLARVLDGVECGCYIDVGANEPDTHSVTRAFYDRGWSGINIEPLLAFHARLAAARPRDINLAVAAGEADGTVIIAEIADTGLSTADVDVAARHARNGYPVLSREVPMLTLDTIWTRHVTGEVHFLKVDVEGKEAAVLAGID